MIARVALAAMLFGGTVHAQSTTQQTAVKIASQPARDVGVSKPVEIPPVLQEAAKAPYAVKGLKSCRQLTGALSELNAALGPDFAGGEKRENRVGKLAEAGGKTVVNAIIPFRGLVREISGAAPAERRYAAAVGAGYARRGFLRGVAHERKCRTG